MVLLCMLCSLAVLELPMQTRLTMNLWKSSCLCLLSAGITEVYYCACHLILEVTSYHVLREHFSFHVKHIQFSSLYQCTIYYVLFFDRFILNKFAVPSFFGQSLGYNNLIAPILPACVSNQCLLASHFPLGLLSSVKASIYFSLMCLRELWAFLFILQEMCPFVHRNCSLWLTYITPNQENNCKTHSTCFREKARSNRNLRLPLIQLKVQEQALFT